MKTWLPRPATSGRAGRMSRRSALGLSASGLVAALATACREETKKTTTTGTSAPTTSAAATAPAAGSPAASAAFPVPPKYSEAAQQKLLAEYHWSKIGAQVQVLGTPRLGGVVALATASFGLQSLHPTEEAVGQWPFCYTHSNLVAMDFSHTANPDLIPATARYAVAESWEQPDASTLVFRLRKNVTWHNKPPANGALLTVEDIRATYELFKKSRFHGLHFKDLARIEEPQPGVVRMTTSEPAAQLLGALRNPSFAILNAKHIDEGDDALKSKAIGTGPFTQEKFQPNAVRVYKRNPNYWWKDDAGNQLPYLDGVVHTVVADPAALVAALRSGQIDYHRPVSAEEFDRLRRELDTWAEVVPGCGCQSFVIAPSHRDPMFKDVRVRRALALAVNSQDIVDTVFGGAATAKDWIPWYYRGRAWPEAFGEQGVWQKYDPAQARQLLQAAGVQTPVKIDLTFSGQVLPGAGTVTGNPYVESVRRDYKAIGVELELKPTDVLGASRTYSGAQWNGLFATSIGGVGLDADLWVQQLVTGAGLNGIGVSDPNLDSLFKKQRSVTDVPARQKIYDEIETYVNRDQVLRGTQLPSGFGFGIWRKYIHNAIDTTSWWINGGSGQQMTHVWLDDKAPRRSIDAF
jgi:peptide/nickel transport system substrate-binding protein